MKNKFLILTLLATTSLATNAWAATNCPSGTTLNTDCWSCGDDCTASLVNGTLTVSGTGAMANYDFYNNKAPWYNSTVTSVVVGKGITSIGERAFGHYTPNGDLISVVISDTVTSIGDSAFYKSSNLASVVIPDSVTSIGGSAFSFATNLTSATLSDSITTVVDFAFYENSSLTSLVIPDSVTSIGEYAFRGTANLTSIVIPDAVTSIGTYAFLSVPNSTEIFCPNEACKAAVSNRGYNGGNFVDYTKSSDGIYTITAGGVMYASAEDMQARQNACTSEAQCREKVQEYKEAKAEQMAQSGVLCQTKQGCLNLMDMVSNSAYVCTTIAACSSAVKAGTYNVNLSEGSTSGGGSGGNGGSSAGSGKRIYTVEEARQAVEAAGTDTVSFRIRYK